MRQPSCRFKNILTKSKNPALKANMKTALVFSSYATVFICAEFSHIICAQSQPSSTNSAATNEGAPPPTNSTLNPDAATQNRTCLYAAWLGWSFQYICQGFVIFNSSNLKGDALEYVNYPVNDICTPNCNDYPNGLDQSPPNPNTSFFIDVCLLVAGYLYGGKDYCSPYYDFSEKNLGPYGIDLVNVQITEGTTCNPSEPLSNYSTGCSNEGT